MPTNQYSNSMTWPNWCSAVGQVSNNLLNDLQQAKMLADKFNLMTYGLTAAQIAALSQFSGITAADAQNMMNAMGALMDMYNAMFNLAAVSQFNREGYLDPFI
ncbi:MAG: hypothetical protein ACLQJ7_17440 [Syntrophobacteraceae bacterium]